ncbi:MAG: GNAT family N-acetyltransferase, partial [Phyllobacterium sp.]|nr:GNAT family N-acetyltransferase [Phyllobacterium sp.]
MLPTFETERLFLRPRTMADLEDCMAMDRDPEVTRFIPGPWTNPDAHRRFITARMEADFGPDLGYWSIFARDQPQRFLGWVLSFA